AMPAALEPVVPTAVLGVCAHCAVHPGAGEALEALLEAVACGWQLVSQLMVTDCRPRVPVTTTLPFTVCVKGRSGQVMVLDLILRLLRRPQLATAAVEGPEATFAPPVEPTSLKATCGPQPSAIRRMRFSTLDCKNTTTGSSILHRESEAQQNSIDS